jgi:putative salt-induced outer membrane protein YdiY
MRFKGWILGAGTAMGLCLASITAADELILKSGEKLTGSIVGIHAGKIKFKSASLGLLEIERSKVETFATDGDVKVVDERGRQWRGRAVADKDGQVKFEAVIAGQEGGIGKSPATPYAAGEVVKVTDIRELAWIADDDHGVWHGKVHAAVTGTRSGTNTNDVDVTANAEYETDTSRIRLYGWYEYGIHDKDGVDEIKRNNYGGGAKYDLKLQDHWYVFAKAQVSHDSIREIDREWILAGGVGKTLYQADGKLFRGEIGLSHIDTRYMDFTPSRSELAGYVAYHLGWRLTDRLDLEHGFTWYPGFGDERNNIIDTYLMLNYEMNKSLTLGIKLTDVYHSKPADNGVKNKFTYGIYLGYKF